MKGWSSRAALSTLAATLLLLASAPVAAQGGTKPKTPLTPKGQPAKGVVPAGEPAARPAAARPGSPDSLPTGGLVDVPDTGKDVGDGDQGPDAGNVERGVRLRSARALVGIEISPGVAIPFRDFLDFGGKTPADRYFMENGAGFGIAITLTLNNIELRYAYSALSTGRVQGRLPDDVYDALKKLQIATGGQPIAQNIDIEADSALKMHHISLGYRITLEFGKYFQLAFPLGFGLVVAQPPAFGIVNYSLFGFGAFAGVRPEFKISDIVAIGVDARFSFYITEPDANLAAAGYAATKKIFENAVAWLPMLSVAASARIYY